MKYCLIILCIAAVCLGFHQQQPKEFIEVNVVVKKGDVLQDIVYDLKQKYNDSRDWREICFEVGELNNLGEFIYPGQVLKIRLVADK